MNIFGAGIIARLRAYVQSINMKVKNAVASYKQKIMHYEYEVMMKDKKIAEFEDQLLALKEDNIGLYEKNNELKKALMVYQSITSDSTKVQKLIIAYKRIKEEVLELRRCSDCTVNELDELKRNNAKLKFLLEEASAEGKVDVNALLDKMTVLKKENSLFRNRCDQLDRLVKSLKEHEKRMLAAMKLKPKAIH